MALPYKEALRRFENQRVKATRPLIPPQILQEDLPLSVPFLAVYLHPPVFLLYIQNITCS